MSKSGRPLFVNEELSQLRTKVMNGDIESVKTIMKKHGINAFDEEKMSALIWASYFGNMVILKWLIANGANVNHQDRGGTSALHICGQEQNCEVAQVLINSGADINIKDEHDNSPLWTALFNAKGNFKLVKILRTHGANPTSKNKYGLCPNDFAMKIYEKDVDELIK
jgi:ankyrin repeat protein